MSDAEARLRPWVQDTGLGNGAVDEPIEAIPRHPLTLAATPQRAHPGHDAAAGDRFTSLDFFNADGILRDIICYRINGGAEGDMTKML